MEGEQFRVTQKSNRILYLDIARTIAIISISFNHAVNRSYSNYSNQRAQFLESSFFDTFIKTITSVLSRIGVPLFLMITGVLILNKVFQDGNDLKKFYKRNYIPMLITTEIWFFLMYWPIVLFFSSNTILEEGGIIGAITELIKTMLFIDQTTLGSMWYMPMILCLYLTLPFWAIVVQKIPRLYISIPLAVSYICFMLMPLINQQLVFMGEERLSVGLTTANLPSFYLLYIIAGYYIDKGILHKIKNSLVLLLAVVNFSACCAYQWYAYSRPQNYLVGYDFPLLLISCFFIFEYIKRKEKLFLKFSFLFTYISKISFGIYFVHIVIMEFLYRFFDYNGWISSLKMLFLELVSVGGSIIIIAVLSKIKIFKKYLFMIKD